MSTADPAALVDAVTEYAEARVYASGLWRTSETNAAIDRLRDEASARLGDARVRLAVALTGPRRADALARRLLAAEQDGREAAFAADWNVLAAGRDRLFQQFQESLRKQKALEADRDRLAAQVQRVRDLHVPMTYDDGQEVCTALTCARPGSGDDVPYPCLTIRALDGGEQS